MAPNDPSCGPDAILGPWPAACPVPAGALAALWDDDSLGARVAAAWLRAGTIRSVVLVPGVDFMPAGAMDAPGGWGPAHAAAVAAGAGWLVVPALWPGDAGRWHAADVALNAAGLGLWRPFALLDRLAVARLGLALGVEVATAPDVDRPLLAALGLRLAPG